MQHVKISDGSLWAEILSYNIRHGLHGKQEPSIRSEMPKIRKRLNELLKKKQQPNQAVAGYCSLELVREAWDTRNEKQV